MSNIFQWIGMILSAACGFVVATCALGWALTYLWEKIGYAKWVWQISRFAKKHGLDLKTGELKTPPTSTQEGEG